MTGPRVVLIYEESCCPRACVRSVSSSPVTPQTAVRKDGRGMAVQSKIAKPILVDAYSDLVVCRRLTDATCHETLGWELIASQQTNLIASFSIGGRSWG